MNGLRRSCEHRRKGREGKGRAPSPTVFLALSRTWRDRPSSSCSRCSRWWPRHAPLWPRPPPPLPPAPLRLVSQSVGRWRGGAGRGGRLSPGAWAAAPGSRPHRDSDRDRDLSSCPVYLRFRLLQVPCRLAGLTPNRPRPGGTRRTCANIAARGGWLAVASRCDRCSRRSRGRRRRSSWLKFSSTWRKTLKCSARDKPQDIRILSCIFY
jgi:hypothetical protein